MDRQIELGNTSAGGTSNALNIFSAAEERILQAAGGNAYHEDLSNSVNQVRDRFQNQELNVFKMLSTQCTPR